MSKIIINYKINILIFNRDLVICINYCGESDFAVHFEKVIKSLISWQTGHSG
jgi:hypothetical protein